MGLIIGGSLAFSIGGAFMKASNGLTRLPATLVVIVSFIIGAGLLTRAVTSANLSTTIVVGLGLEAVLTIGIGIVFLGDRISVGQAFGMLMVLAGVTLVRFSA
jgi:multidrug transporter EmrE-like cation transporter